MDVMLVIIAGNGFREQFRAVVSVGIVAEDVPGRLLLRGGFVEQARLRGR